MDARFLHRIHDLNETCIRNASVGLNVERIPHGTMRQDSFTGALREIFDPAVAVRARALAHRVSRNGAEIAARRLAAEF